MKYDIKGMSCAACQVHIEKAVSKVKGVDKVSVSLLTNEMVVEGNATEKDIVKAVENAGYGAINKDRNTKADEENDIEASFDNKEIKHLIKRLLYSVSFLIVLMYLSMGYNMLHLPLPEYLDKNYVGLGILQMILATIVMIINKDFFISGFKSAKNLAPNMDTLVALGSSVSFVWSVFILLKMTVLLRDKNSIQMIYMKELYFESAAMIPALITVGKTLESYSKGRTTDALKSLIKMAPRKALVEKNGEIKEVAIDEVLPGDIFIVKPGGIIPLDGEVIEGGAAIDESMLTGESIPVDKKEGDTVAAATKNVSGFIKAKAIRVGEDTTFSKIIKMVRDAASTKAPIARIADRVSYFFVPAVILVAFVVFIIWIISGETVAFAVERAVSVLVISCPCALGLATPVAIMVGNGVGAKNGILFKTSEALEVLGKIDIVALDKTGTITEGRPVVADIIGEERLLQVAYSLELLSEHPLAMAISLYGEEKGTQKFKVEDFKALSGNGLKGKINGETYYGGSMNFIKSIVKLSKDDEKIIDDMSSSGKTPVLFATEKELLGIISLRDKVKEDSLNAISEMKNMGIKVVMLTGDNKNTAMALNEEVKVDEVMAGLLPDGKKEVIDRLKKLGKTAMVGDGINDAPSLKSSDVGIAIGSGTDVAIDSGDVVLVNSDLSSLSAAIRLSRWTLRNIYQNLFWAFGYNIILIPMAAGLFKGINMNPIWGALAMSLSSFTVCMNALRINLYKIHSKGKDRKRKNNIDFSTINKGETNMKKTLKIEGMMCAHCEAAVKKALLAIPGIEEAEVSHEKGTAEITLSSSVDEEVIKKAIEDKDYKFLGAE